MPDTPATLRARARAFNEAADIVSLVLKMGGPPEKAVDALERESEKAHAFAQELENPGFGIRHNLHQVSA